MLLPRLTLRSMIAPTVLFAAVIALICAQPSDDSDLLALLNPADCAMPCFIGIRPGTTTLTDALDIIDTHPWVGLHDDGMVANTGAITWSWNSDTPAVIDTDEIGWIWVSGGMVESIVVRTRAPLGVVWLSLGTPRHALVAIDYNDRTYKPEVVYMATYPDDQITLITTNTCTTPTPWHAATRLVFESPLLMGGSVMTDRHPERPAATRAICTNLTR